MKKLAFSGSIFDVLELNEIVAKNFSFGDRIKIILVEVEEAIELDAQISLVEMNSTVPIKVRLSFKDPANLQAIRESKTLGFLEGYGEGEANLWVGVGNSVRINGRMINLYISGLGFSNTQPIKETGAIFKSGDYVYYPVLSTKVFQIKTRAAENYPTVLGLPGEVEYFTEDGKLFHNHEFPSLWLATPENREKLSKFYGVEFEEAPNPIEEKLPHLCLVSDVPDAFEGLCSLRDVECSDAKLRVVQGCIHNDPEYKFITDGGVRWKFAKLCKLNTDGALEFVEI